MENGKTLAIPKGGIVFKEGEVTGEAYRILSGRLEVSKELGGKKVVLARLGPGQFFGEMGLILESARSATVTALEDCVVRPISRETFNRLLKKEPASLLPLIKVLFERLRVMNLKYAQALESAGGDPAKAAAAIEAPMAAPASPSPAPKAGAGSILVLRGESDLTQKLLGKDGKVVAKFPFRIGRKQGSIFGDAFSLNDLYIPDEQPFQVSRNHCSIDVSPDGAYFVLDRGSRIGTFVNGERLGSGSGRLEARLKGQGNVIVLGHHNSPFRFNISFKEK